MTSSNNCIFILSGQSSGSGVLHNFLAMHNCGAYLEYEGHEPNESHYWLRAAASLQLPLVPMLASSVSLNEKKAVGQLRDFIARNISAKQTLPPESRDAIFDNWRALCQANAPVLLDKSPSCLLQWPVLELLQEAIERLSGEVDFYLLGLVRNPMDVIYSYWKHWQVYPHKKDCEWRQEYSNLLKARELFGDRLHVLRYEDFVQSSESPASLASFLGLPELPGSNLVHSKSMGMWKKDDFFSYRLSAETMELAMQYGYTKEQLQKPAKNRALWPVLKHGIALRDRISRKLS